MTLGFYANSTYHCLMKKNRIELHFSEEETTILNKASKKQQRSRKNYCEVELMKTARKDLKK